MGEIITLNESMLFPRPVQRVFHIKPFSVGNLLTRFGKARKDLLLVDSGIASSMETVASKVFMGKPPLMVIICRESISSYWIDYT